MRLITAMYHSGDWQTHVRSSADGGPPYTIVLRYKDRDIRQLCESPSLELARDIAEAACAAADVAVETFIVSVVRQSCS